MSKEVVKVPDIGDYEGVDVIEVLVKVGDEISAEDPIVSLETDKATMEVPSPVAGKVLAVHIKEGGKVSEESQGLEGARDMFATAQRLEGVM